MIFLSLHIKLCIIYNMLRMDDSAQNCMGDEEDGYVFFKNQNREIDMVLSHAIRLHQRKVETGIVVIKNQNEHLRLQRGNGQYYRNRNHEKRPLMQKEKEIYPVQRNKKQQQSISNQKEVIIHQKAPQIDYEQKKQSLTQKIPQKNIQINIFQAPKQQQKSQIAQDRTSIMHLSNDSNQKNNEMLNLAYIESAYIESLQTKTTVVEEDLTAFLQKQFGYYKQNKEPRIQAQINDISQEMFTDFDLQNAMIDLNPKNIIKKDKKTKKGKQGKIFLEKHDQSFLQFSIGNNKSFLIHNEASINKSSVSSEKSINLTFSISKQLANLRIQTFQNSPKKQVFVQLLTNECISSVKIESIYIVPLKKILEVKSKNNWKIVTFNETQYEFPSRHYYEHVKKLSLCVIGVPDLSINLLKDEDYYDILAGLLIKIVQVRLKCTNCSAKLNVTIKNLTNKAIQSCQKCSMPLKIVVNSLSISSC